MSRLVELMAAAPGPTRPSGAADPLAQLPDIHTPPPPAFWPPAPGWWLLAALIVAASAALGLWVYRAHQRHRPWRDAAALLAAAHSRALGHAGAEADAHGPTAPADPAAARTCFAAATGRILRRAALTAYPRAQVAALTGEGWLQFLDTTGDTDAFSRGAGRDLVERAYRPAPAGVAGAGADRDAIDALAALAHQWLRRQRRRCVHPQLSRTWTRLAPLAPRLSARRRSGAASPRRRRAPDRASAQCGRAEPER